MKTADDDCTYWRGLAKLGLQEKTSRNPLFDAVFSFQGLSDFAIQEL